MPDASSEERELKFEVASLDAILRRLAQLGAVPAAPPSQEVNWLFDRDGELAGSGRVLRLRADDSGDRLTYKGRASYEAGVKTREEHEFRIDDARAARALLEGLGYRASWRYDKVRQTVRLDGCEVALDHTPIGDYVEFEGPRAEEVARLCQLDPEVAEPRSYPELYQAYRDAHPNAPEFMTFGE